MHFIYLIIGILAFSCTGKIFASDHLAVNNVEISSYIGNLEDAKMIALEDGATSALQELLKKVNVSENADITKCLEKSQSPMKLIDRYEILSERMTSRSYSANVNFVFKKDNVDVLMNRCKLRYSTHQAGATLLVPLIRDRNSYRPITNELDHALFQAIDEIDNNVGSFSFKKILLDDSMEYDIETDALITGGYNEIIDHINSYGTKSAVVIIFDRINTKKLSVAVRMIGHNSVYEDSYSYSLPLGEEYSGFINRVIKDLIEKTDSLWKRGMADEKEKIFTSNVLFEVSNHSDWGKIQNILRKTNLVKQYRFKNITNNEIELEIKYIKAPEVLSTRLLQEGVAIFKRDSRTVMKLIEK